MKDGIVSIVFRPTGKIGGIYTNTSLDAVYRRMFNSAKRNIKRSARIDNGIKIIVFGCFWLEATYNNVLRKMIIRQVNSGEFAKEIWHAMKRGNFQEKVQKLGSLASDEQKKKLLKLTPDIKKLFDLRNRLAHFKDEDFQIAGETSIVEALLLTLSAPDTELFKELHPPKINGYIDIVVNCQAWLNDTFKLDKVTPLRRSEKTNQKITKEKIASFLRILLKVDKEDGVRYIFELGKEAKENNRTEYFQAACKVLEEVGAYDKLRLLDKS